MSPFISRLRHGRRLGAVAALSGFAAALPLASASAQTTELPTITVEGRTPGRGAGSLTSPDLETQRRAVVSTPGSVSHIDAETYGNSYATNLRDVLQDTPGVLVQNRYSQEIRLSIRGSGLARSFHTRGIEILQDGIPTNLADGSGDFYQIDPSALRAIEVFRGGNALPFGSSTLGGAVNFVTPTGYTAVSPNSFRLDGGSFGTLRAHGQVSRVIGDWDVSASGTYTHSDGWRQHETQNLGHFNATVGRRLSERVETRFYFGAYYTDVKLPGALTYGQSMTTPRMANAGAVAGDQARNTYVQRFANVTSISFDFGKLDITSWAIHKHLNHPIFQVLDQDGWTYGISPRFTGSFNLGGFRNDVVVGARLFAGSNAVQQFLNLGNAMRGALTQQGRQNATNTEAWFENRFFILPEVALTAGAKAYISQRQFIGGLNLNTLAPVAVDRSITYSGVNPRVGILWEPLRDVQVFANLTRSADVPDFTDLMQTTATTAAFVPLRAQTGTTVEVGTRGRHGRFAWELTGFQANLRDQMLQFNVGPGIPASTFNAPRTRLQGLEFAGSVDLAQDLTGQGDKVTLRQVWTYSDFRFSGDPVYGNNVLPLVPRHVLRTALSYQHPRFTVTPAIDIVPEGAFVDYANTFRVPGYWLLGVTASAKLPNGGELFLDVRNILDRRHIADFGPVTVYNAASSAVFYPGTGRSVYGGLRVKF